MADAEESRLPVKSLECYRNREKSPRVSLYGEIDVFYIVDIQSNPDKRIGVASSMRGALTCATNRTERYEELTGVCQLLGAAIGYLLPLFSL